MSGVLLAGAVAAALELDASHVAQLLLSRPLVMGPAVGCCVGAVELGAVVGALFELLSLADVPVGGHLPWSAPVAAAVGTLALATGAETLWLPGGAAAGLAHARLEAFERRRRSRWADALARDARAGAAPRFGPYLAGSVLSHLAATFALILAGRAALAWAEPLVPVTARIALFYLAALAAPLVALTRIAVAEARRA